MENRASLLQIETSSLIAGFCLIVAVLAYSSSAIFFRVSTTEISSNATVFDRMLITSVLFGLWSSLRIIQKKFWPQSLKEEEFELRFEAPRDIWMLPAMAISYVLFLALWSWSLTQTTVAISLVLLSLKPLFTCFLAWLIWKQHFDRKFLIGMTIAVVGVAAIGLGDWQVGEGRIQGDIAALIAGICEAIYLLVLEKLTARMDKIAALLWCSVLGSLLTLPIFLLTETRLFPISLNGWVAVISLALVCQVLAQIMLVYSLKKFSPVFVSLALLLESVVAGIAAWGVLGESLRFSEWTSISVILIGLYFSLSSQSAVKT